MIRSIIIGLSLFALCSCSDSGWTEERESNFLDHCKTGFKRGFLKEAGGSKVHHSEETLKLMEELADKSCRCSLTKFKEDVPDPTTADFQDVDYGKYMLACARENNTGRDWTAETDTQFVSLCMDGFLASIESDLGAPVDTIPEMNRLAEEICGCALNEVKLIYDTPEAAGNDRSGVMNIMHNCTDSTRVRKTLESIMGH